MAFMADRVQVRVTCMVKKFPMPPGTARCIEWSLSMRRSRLLTNMWCQMVGISRRERSSIRSLEDRTRVPR